MFVIVTQVVGHHAEWPAVLGGGHEVKARLSVTMRSPAVPGGHEVKARVRSSRSLESGSGAEAIVGHFLAALS